LVEVVWWSRGKYNCIVQEAVPFEISLGVGALARVRRGRGLVWIMLEREFEDAHAWRF